MTQFTELPLHYPKIIKMMFERPKLEGSRYKILDTYPSSFERMRFNRWQKKQMTSINVFQFLDAISYADIKFSFLALAHVRDYNLLQINFRSERVLEVFVQHLGNAINDWRVKYHEGDEILINAPPNFVLWILKYQRSFGPLARLGIDFLDSVSQFLEEIKKKQAK